MHRQGGPFFYDILEFGGFDLMVLGGFWSSFQFWSRKPWETHDKQKSKENSPKISLELSPPPCLLSSPHPFAPLGFSLLLSYLILSYLFLHHGPVYRVHCVLRMLSYPIVSYRIVKPNLKIASYRIVSSSASAKPNRIVSHRRAAQK